MEGSNSFTIPGTSTTITWQTAAIMIGATAFIVLLTKNQPQSIDPRARIETDFSTGLEDLQKEVELLIANAPIPPGVNAEYGFESHPIEGDEQPPEHPTAEGGLRKDNRVYIAGESNMVLYNNKPLSPYVFNKQPALTFGEGLQGVGLI